MAPQLDAFFKQVDDLSDHFIDRLSKAVAIPSVSAEDERRPEVVRVSTPSIIHPTNKADISPDGPLASRRAQGFGSRS
jgi:hypothetical protein